MHQPSLHIFFYKTITDQFKVTKNNIIQYKLETGQFHSQWSRPKYYSTIKKVSNIQQVVHFGSLGIPPLLQDL